MRVEYLILGGGIAGWTAAETLRKLSPNSEIGLVSEEAHPLYSRVLLPHYIGGKIPRERVFLRSEDNHIKHNIRLFAGRTAVALDTRTKKILLDDGEEIAFKKLLLATGGRAIVPEEKKLSNSHLFRTLEDSDDIIKALNSLSPGTLCSAVGSSFIALEFPPLFEKFGMKTAMYMRGPGFFHRLLDRDSMELIEDVIREHGGVVYKNMSGLNALAESRFVGIGLGTETNVRFAKDAGIETGTGIITNEYLETNTADIWAAGDVAEFYDIKFGRHRLLGNWMNAEMQGRVAAINMAEEKTQFNMVSSYATRLFDLIISFIGDVSLDKDTKIAVRGSRQSGSLTRILLRNGKIVGATLLGNVADRGPLTELIQKGAEIGELAPLEDKSFDLKNIA